MNITTNNTFDEIELAIQALPYPVRPVTPHLAPSKQQTPAALRAHADALESYETMQVEYEKRIQSYRSEKAALEQVWRDKLRNDFTNLNDVTFRIVYDMAWERGHSSGYGEVRNYMDEIETFASAIIKANKT